VKKLEQINPYLERASKDVSACFYHSILVFRLNNKNIRYKPQCTSLDLNNFPIIFNHFFTNPI